tara:strand:+ start:4473 stop:5408 length:936 start_codon:yes stop_codon:yes gene_type:complete
MWDDEGTALGLVGAPIYSGQVIPKNFVLEVFTILNETAPALATALTIASTIRTVPVDYRVRGSYEDDAAPTVVTDYQVQMPARGGGQDLLLDGSNLTLGALTVWPDQSGNANDLPLYWFGIGTPTAEQASDGLVFKDSVYVHFEGATIGISSVSQIYRSVFIVFQVASWMPGARIIKLANGLDLTLGLTGGNRDVLLNTVSMGFPALADNTNYLLELHFEQSGGNLIVTGGIYGDQEGAASLATGATPTASVLNIHQTTYDTDLKVAEVGCYLVTPSAAIKKAERDYLITKYIGWTTDLNFNADVAGDDNP